MNALVGVSNCRARALYLGERIDVRALENLPKLASAPLVIAVGERGCAVVFRYGVAVLVNVSALEEAAVLEQLKRYIGEPIPKPESEDTELRVSSDKTDGIEPGRVMVAEMSVERIQIVAEILARAVALNRYESVLRETFDAVEPWAKSLSTSGSGGKLERHLLKNLGNTLLVQHTMAGRIEFDDKPELIWERPDLERLYLRLEDEYELKERDKVLERKIALITQTAEILLNRSSNKTSNRLEIYIILLIMAELALSLFQLWRGH